MPRTLALALLLASAALAAPSTAAAAVSARGSVEQVHVTGARPGSAADARSTAAASRAAPSAPGRSAARCSATSSPGGLPRARATARPRAAPTRSAPPTHEALPPDDPDERLRLPDHARRHAARDQRPPARPAPGPYPTLVEYSGYGYANPDGRRELDRARSPTCSATRSSTSTCAAPAARAARSTTSSRSRALDGYDVIETVARQPWVAHHKVGMVGISYGGISQLFVAATRPPSLAAITPLSVIDNTATTLYPGGILNTGFALSWAKDRVHDAKPASPTGGQRVGARAHPRRRRDLQGQPGAARRGRRPAREGRARTTTTSRRSPTRSRRSTFVHKINVPVFLACQWTDEQTGGHCPTLRAALHRHAPQVVHVHQRHAHRLARPGHVHALVRLPRALRRAPRAAAVARGARRRAGRSSAPRWASRASRCPTTRSRPSRATPRRGRPSRRCRRSGSCSTTAPAARRRARRSRVRALVRALPAAGHARAVVVPRPPAGRCADAKPAAAGVDAFTWSRTARPPTNFTGNTRRPERPVDGDARRTAGRRTPRGRRSPT